MGQEQSRVEQKFSSVLIEGKSVIRAVPTLPVLAMAFTEESKTAIQPHLHPSSSALSASPALSHVRLAPTVSQLMSRGSNSAHTAEEVTVKTMTAHVMSIESNTQSIGRSVGRSTQVALWYFTAARSMPWGGQNSRSSLALGLEILFQSCVH